MSVTQESNLDQYRRTYAYKSLLEKYSLDDTGIWEILGEDPNCDMRGYHHQPNLGYVSGKLSDVIAYAVELPKFWGWGAGGDIRQYIAPTVVTINEDTKKLRRDRRELQKQIADLNSEIDEKIKRKDALILKLKSMGG